VGREGNGPSRSPLGIDKGPEALVAALLPEIAPLEAAQVFLSLLRAVGGEKLAGAPAQSAVNGGLRLRHLCDVESLPVTLRFGFCPHALPCFGRGGGPRPNRLQVGVALGLFRDQGCLLCRRLGIGSVPAPPLRQCQRLFRAL